MLDSGSTRKTRVLFVCLGNICRSPSAEGVVRHYLQTHALQHLIEHDSCGTHGYHIGSPPDARAMQHAQKRGVDISDLRGRQVKPGDFEHFDMILAADEENLANLRAMCPAHLRHKLQLMMDFSVGWKGEAVPDPYYGGAEGFEQVLDMLQDMAEGLSTFVARQR